MAGEPPARKSRGPRAAGAPRGPGGQRVAILVSYEGGAFHGNAYQSSGARTVEGELLAALGRARVAGDAAGAPDLAAAGLERAGRTDAGVSAAGMVYSLAAAPCARWALPGAGLGDLPLLLNRHLGPGVRVLGACAVGAGFSARASAVARRYRYLLWAGAAEGAGGGARPRLGPMRACAALFRGTHDFSAFARLGTNRLCGAADRAERFREDPVRTVFECDVEEEGGRAVLRVTGSSFLYHQVRYMASAVLRVGRGELGLEEVGRMLGGGGGGGRGAGGSQAGPEFDGFPGQKFGPELGEPPHPPPQTPQAPQTQRPPLGPASRLVFEAALYPGEDPGSMRELPFFLSPAAREDLVGRAWAAREVCSAWERAVAGPGPGAGDRESAGGRAGDSADESSSDDPAGAHGRGKSGGRRREGRGVRQRC